MTWDDIDFDDDFEETDSPDDDESPSHSDVDPEASYLCDHCGEEIVIPIDLAAGQEQTYVEDCPVCCCPSVIHVWVDEDRIDVRAEPEQDHY
ncbi:CPXCG motif-containing cysteine-rich protein [Neorhodopirellula pilleata]|uniref:Cysteine-rich CPXCG n=1 Tax=Neorhodopirellula pilleata TaxID=2714738 RepID=A0A5C6A8C8_9BACT|nr:CPXCG motif-containing cysteine-rich protein [Neorhodopirellula pilleata]TWT95706.1 hypothetical protein Pla100_33480 [Neorhodopirellula pilleata]